MNEKFSPEYLPITVNDIDDIFELISRDNPSIGKQIIDEFDKNIGNISSFPKMGYPPKDKRLQSLGYRVLVIRNYLVFYVIKEKEKIVEIKRVIHGRRRYSFLL